MNSGNNNLYQKKHTNTSPIKDKTAVALSYASDELAPRILATGKGYLAERIIERAGENKIPIHKDEMLTNTLSRLEVGDFIPPELYNVVAEVLVFVDKMDSMKKKVYEI